MGVAFAHQILLFSKVQVVVSNDTSFVAFGVCMTSGGIGVS